MIHSYAYTPFIWPSVFTVLLLIALGLYAWRRRRVPGALPFTIGCLFAALWAAGSIMEVTALDVAAQVFWVKFQAIWPLPALTATFCFALEYTWPGRWLNRRNLVLLSIVPLLALGLMLTNGVHHLLWRDFKFDGSVIIIHGPAYWGFLAYTFGLAFIEIIVFAWLFINSSQHRWPVIFMMIGQLAGWTIYLLYGVNAVRSRLPLDVLAIAMVFLTYAIALFGFHILDPVTLARQTAINQLHAAILVLDANGRVVGLNPSAERIFGVSAAHLNGRLVQDLLPAYPMESPGDLSRTEIEFSMGVGQEAGFYTLSISLFKDWRGLEVGRLLMLRDMTERKQIQDQIVRQQRALATLNEREQMARELHDSLGQVLGYARFQVEAISMLVRNDKGDAAADQLDRLGRVIHEAHTDLREVILNLRSAPSLGQPFFAAVKQYLQGYTSNYDIQTHLAVGPEVGEGSFTPDAQLQVFRIMQEALSNARKHGQARHVEVTFTANDGHVCMTILDDGRGFTPENLDPTGSGHFGLQFMHERAAQLGGCLQVKFAPGEGTRVILDAPAINDAVTQRWGDIDYA